MAIKKDYHVFANSFMKQYSAKNKDFVKHLLSSEDVKDSYHSLTDKKVPDQQINEIFKKSVKNVQEGNRSRPDEFVHHLTEHVARKGHKTVIDDFFKKGLIGKKHYEKSQLGVTQHAHISYKLGEYIRGVMFFSFVLALFFLLKSTQHLDLTKAVIGEDVIDLNVIYGTIFLVFALSLVHFYYRRKGAQQKLINVENSTYVKDLMIVSFLFASYFLIKSLSNGNFIGAVTGGGETDLDVIYGVVFLLFGLALSHFYYRRE